MCSSWIWWWAKVFSLTLPLLGRRRAVGAHFLALPSPTPLFPLTETKGNVFTPFKKSGERKPKENKTSLETAEWNGPEKSALLFNHSVLTNILKIIIFLGGIPFTSSLPSARSWAGSGRGTFGWPASSGCCWGRRGTRSSPCGSPSAPRGPWSPAKINSKNIYNIFKKVIYGKSDCELAWFFWYFLAMTPFPYIPPASFARGCDQEGEKERGGQTLQKKNTRLPFQVVHHRYPTGWPDGRTLKKAHICLKRSPQ